MAALVKACAAPPPDWPRALTAFEPVSRNPNPNPNPSPYPKPKVPTAFEPVSQTSNTRKSENLRAYALRASGVVHVTPEVVCN